MAPIRTASRRGGRRVIDTLFLSALICITAACALAYLLGRFHGMSAAYEDMHQMLQSSDDVPSDQFPVFDPADEIIATRKTA